MEFRLTTIFDNGMLGTKDWKTNIRLGLMCALILTFTRCTKIYYKPNAVNAPCLYAKGQGTLTVSGSLLPIITAANDSIHVLDVQGAYSPIAHLGIIVNHSTARYSIAQEDSSLGKVNGTGNLTEAGAGYYRSYGKGKFKLLGDIYAGYGAGRLHSDINAHINRIFIQPGIGITSPYFDVFFKYRIAGTKFSRVTSTYDTYYLMQHNIVDAEHGDLDSRRYWFSEPSLTFRFGYKYAKAEVQAVYSEKPKSVYWSSYPLNVSIGMTLQVDEIVHLFLPKKDSDEDEKRSVRKKKRPSKPVTSTTNQLH